MERDVAGSGHKVLPGCVGGHRESGRDIGMTDIRRLST